MLVCDALLDIRDMLISLHSLDDFSYPDSAPPITCGSSFGFVIECIVHERLVLIKVKES